MEAKIKTMSYPNGQKYHILEIYKDGVYYPIQLPSEMSFGTRHDIVNVLNDYLGDN